MAQLNINIPVDKLAGMINNMETNELETLCLLLNNEGRELLRRKKETEYEDIQLISRNDVFNDTKKGKFLPNLKKRLK
jgi:hypothetical protein